MTREKIERVKCDFDGCANVSLDGAKFWVTVKAIAGVETNMDGTIPERHICTDHDQQNFAQILIGLGVDRKRLERRVR